MLTTTTTAARAVPDIKQGRGRALCAAGGALAAALAWIVEVPLLGIHLTFRFGTGHIQTIAAGQVIGVTVAASLLGWLLLALLQRRIPCPAPVDSHRGGGAGCVAGAAAGRRDYHPGCRRAHHHAPDRRRRCDPRHVAHGARALTAHQNTGGLRTLDSDARQPAAMAGQRRRVAVGSRRARCPPVRTSAAALQSCGARAARRARGHAADEEVGACRQPSGTGSTCTPAPLAMSERAGEIVEVRGAGGEPPYLVRFDDGHTALVFPRTDAIISIRAESAERQGAGARLAHGLAQPVRLRQNSKPASCAPSTRPLPPPRTASAPC